MKTKRAFPLAAGFLLAAALAGPARAEPLNATTAVQTEPDPGAPVITFLKAGSEPVPASAIPAQLPPGWMAVAVPGPFTGYVLNRDLTKMLDPRPGAPVYLAPKAGAGVLLVAQKGDKTEITGLLGRWTQVRIEKDLVGYIRVGPPASGTGAPIAVAPPGVPAVTTAPGRPAAEEAGQTSYDAVPRTFEGRFVSTRRGPFSPRRPYAWQLDNDAGVRYAYLDVGKLLLTDQIENYANHDVIVSGPVKQVLGTDDLVIEVDSLRLK